MNKPTINIYNEDNSKVVVMNVSLENLDFNDKIKLVKRFTTTDLKTFKLGVEMAYRDTLKELGLSISLEESEETLYRCEEYLKRKGITIIANDLYELTDREIIYKEEGLTIVEVDNSLEVAVSIEKVEME